MNPGYLYILSNYTRTTLYIGVTNNLEKRIIEHWQKTGSKFTEKYDCKYLVYYESYEDITQAILREKQLKNWRREWKINLVKSINPEMKDLSVEWKLDRS